MLDTSRAKSALGAISAVLGAVVFTSGAGLVMARAPRELPVEALRDPRLRRVEPEPDSGELVEVVGGRASLTTFCGGGGGWLERPAAPIHQRPRNAREIVIDALREGRVEEWERPSALAMLAEAQLVAGEHGRAIVNYRRALAIDPESVPQARVGLATALFLSGARRTAFEEAKLARASVCASRTSMIACYSAHAIVARTAQSDADRDAAELAIRMIRNAQPGAAWQLDVVAHRLDG